MTAPIAEYQVQLKDQSGDTVAIFTDWQGLSFTRKVNSYGFYRFEIEGNDSRIPLFELDGQIEIRRRVRELGIDWYTEFEGFHRSYNDLILSNGQSRYVSYGFGYTHLLKRRRILYYPDTSYTRKSGPGETVIKEFVDENAGPSATNPPRLLRSGVFTGLTIESDAAGGTTWNGTRSYKNLLKVIQDIAIETGIDFDVVGNGPATFQFRCYAGQRGEDRTTTGLDPITGLNGAGNAPVVFSTGRANMLQPIYSNNRSEEITHVIGLGSGVADERNLRLVSDATAAAASPWNDIEVTQSVSGNYDDDEIDDRAGEILNENGAIESFSFDVLQTNSSFYGANYNLGDLVTADFKGREHNKKIVEARINVDAPGNPENIALIFDDFARNK